MKKWAVPFSMFGTYVVEGDTPKEALTEVAALRDDGIIPDWEGFDVATPEPAAKWQQVTR